MKKHLFLFIFLFLGLVIKAQEARDSVQLDFSSLPVLKVQSYDSIKDEPKTAARMVYQKDSIVYEKVIGIEWRGNSALKYPKKSYDLEIWMDTISKESKDLTLGGLREDDDWILNSIYNEPIKLRSYFSNKLWLELSQSRGKDSLHKGKAGIDVAYVEVFLNDDYQGLYLLSEQVDRKQLDLKKFQNDTVRGELFKGGSYAVGSSFSGVKTFNNAFPHWDGFEMEYPYEDYTAHWDNLYEFVDFVVNGDDKTFAEDIASRLDLDNAVDYYIFINVLRATDNMGKNYFLARNDATTPYYFVPWDLDGVLGCIMDGKRISTTNDILSNGLFDRLLADNPADYRKKLTERWKELRTGSLETEKLTTNIRAIYEGLESNGLYERDGQVWPMEVPAADHLEYLLKWLNDRLTYLDGYFGSF